MCTKMGDVYKMSAKTLHDRKKTYSKTLNQQKKVLETTFAFDVWTVSFE